MNFKNYFFTLTIIFILAVSQAFAGDLYWVGNSGNWNDASHWAAVSGGKGGVGVPTFSDNVYFDNQSFLQKDAVVNINSSISVNNLNIISQKDFAITSSKNTEINIFGSIQVTANFNNQIKSDIRFKSAKNETVHLGWFVWQADIYFDGTGTYKLTSPIQNHNNELHHVSGRLDLNQHDVLCGSFISNSNEKRILISEKSAILSYHQFDVQNKKNEYDFSNTTIYDLSKNNVGVGSTDKTVTVATVNNDTVSCGNNCDGTLVVTATTTCPTASVDWLPGPNVSLYTGECHTCSIPGPNILDTITDLCPGVYTAVVRDSCSGVTVLAPQGRVEGHPSIVPIFEDVVQTSCKDTCDGSVTVAVTGASYAVFSYQWYPIPPLTIADTNSTITGLCAGTYSLEVQDGFGCVDTFDYVVGEPDYVLPNVTTTDILCYGVCDGTATAAPTGGNGGYSYQWSANAAPPNVLTNPGIIDLCIGSYTVDVLDSKNCPGTETITIFAPDSLTVTSSQINVSCGGYCDATASATVIAGGVGPYTHNWSTTFIETIPAGQTSTINLLCAGTYTDSIVDANGCDTVLTFIITEPDTLLTTTTFTNVKCFGANDGTAITSPYNGTAPYTYGWSCGPSTFDSIVGIGPGQCIVTVTDTMGCVIQDTITLTEPDILLANPSVVQDMSCPGVCDGIATSNPTGGTTPYSWVWNNPGDITQTTTTGLCQGFVTVTVTDSNLCVAIDSVFIDEPIPMVLTMNSTDATCDGTCDGTGGVDVIGGTPGYTYNWLPAPPNGQGTDTIWQLCAPNTYTVTVIDNNGAGCSASNSITINEPTPVTATITTVNLRCNGLCEGSATITPAGGTPPYRVSLDGGIPVSVVGASITLNNLCALPNPHTLDVIDTNGCTTPLTFVITEPPVLTTTSTSTNLTCTDSCIGTGTTFPLGGTSPYTYSWTNTDLTQTADSLCAGTWFVTVTDDSLCTVMDSVVITQPDTLNPNVSFTDITCNNANNGTAVSLPFGGTPTYTIQWNTFPVNVNPIGSLSAGQYYVTVTDTNGCTARDTITITNPSLIVVNPSAIGTSCETNCDGQATVNPTGGTGSLASWSFLWCVTAETTQTTSATLCPGTYCITVTDSMGCSKTDSATIAPSIVITILTDTVGISCNGLCDGTATANPAGGVLPYSYLWDNLGPDTTQTADSLCPGTYTVTVTDSTGCVATASATMSVAPDVLLVNGSFTPIVCNGDNNGTISAAPSGGTLPYDTTFSITPQIGLPPGTYWVSVTDANGCSDTNTLVITEPDTISPNATVVSVNCNGDSTGSISLAPSGGTPGYTYSWCCGLGTNPSVSNLIAGTYTVTITDTVGCSRLDTFVITQPTVFVSNPYTVPESCFGVCDGIAGITVSGGTEPHTTSWSTVPPLSTDTIFNLCPGIYSVISIDTNGCSTSQNITVLGNPQLVANVTGTPIQCNGACTGTATATPSGGAGGYTYLWTSGGSPIPNPADSTNGGLCPDTYNVTVTDSNGCTAVGSYVVSNVAILQVTLDSTNITCNGANNGTAIATPVGGTPPYQFSWVGGSLPIPTNTDTINNLIPGIHTVTVTDTNGCFFIGSVNITQPSLIVPNQEIIDANCGFNDGSIIVVPTGGTGTYTHSWSNGFTSDTLTGLGVGFYTDTITDFNGCVQTFTFPISNPDGPEGVTATVIDASCFGACDGAANVIPIGGTPGYTYTWNGVLGDSTITGQCAGTLNLTVTDALGCVLNTFIAIDEADSITTNSTFTGTSCNGTCDGTASVTPSGGTAPYTYLWSNGQTTPSVSNLCLGFDTVTITDFKGCTKVVIFDITSPNVLTVSTTTTDITCNGADNGTATATPLDGTPNYTYSWTDPLAQITQTAANLPVGTFVVTVTDDNGCSVKDTITINEPSLIVANETTTDATCGANDGTATVAPTGGSGGVYDFDWTPLAVGNVPSITGPAGTYPVEITDGNGCQQTFLIPISNVGGPIITTNSTNVSCSGVCDGTSTVSVISGTPNYDYLWTGGFVTQTVTGLCEDTYTVQVTDGNNCISVATVTIGANAPITANVSTIDVTCNGGSDGSALVVPVGGVPSYSYSWSGPCPVINGNAVAGLCAGTYTVTITDNVGCSSPITVVINEPTILTVNATANNLTCFAQSDGSATATPAGGTAGYSFLWSDAVTTTPTISGLTAGVYSVIVTDDNGCTATDSVTIFSGNAMTANFNTTDATCGLCDGSATINVDPGSNPYTYLWLPINKTTPTVNNLCPGAYDVEVTNVSGCTQTFTVLISNPTGPTITTAADSASCYGSCDGLAWTIVNAGNPPYTFQWNSPGLPTNDTATALCAGLYDVIVQDSLGCITVDTIRIDQPAQILANLTTTPISCFGDTNGTATVNPSGGIGVYNVTWSNFDVGLTATNLAAGPHSVTITDGNGCSIIKNFNLLAPTVINMVMSSTSTTCNGDCDGTALATVNGGTPPYIYSWNTTPIQNNSLATSLCAGLYTDTVTDSRGCIKIDTISVITPDSLFTTSTPSDVICNGENSGSIFTSPTGGVPNYSYIWSTVPPQFTQTAIDLFAGTYNVIVVDANNCTAYDTVTVNEPNTLNDSTTVNGPTCGVCDGSATANPVGGVGPYAYIWGGVVTDTAQTITGLCAGIITLQITDLGTGCVYDYNVIVNSVTGPTVVLTITGESCPGSCDGTALASASNGNPPYSFSWTPPGTLPTLGDSIHSGLCSDFYTVEVTDAIGCISTDTFSITSTGLNLSIINVIPESCFNACDGSATVVAGAGLAPFTYQWNPSSNTDSVAINLCVGNYTAVVTDSLNCRDSIGTTITGPTLLTVSIDLTTPITCNAVCDGVLSATVLGGTPGYTYLWSDGQNTPIATNLCADTIWVEVTDGNGCTAYDTLVLTEPTPILANEQLFTPACNVCDGSIELYPSGGVGSYDFLWTGPIAVAGEVTPIVISLCADVYTVDITDDNGCTNTFTFALSNTNAPDPNTTVIQPTCNNVCDGSITANPTGGTAPYTYVWSPNANPPNINLFDTTITNLCPDIFSVEVTDSLGCIGIETDTIINPTLLLANIDSSNITCNGFNDGWAVVHPSGGAVPYNTAIWTSIGTFDSISNLAPNTYYVSVTDANGCTVQDSVIITEPTLITTTPNVIDASCSSVCDGQATLNASGGTGGYTYNWVPTSQTTDPAVNLCFGSYSVTITDQSGCIILDTINVGSIDTVLAFAGNDTIVCAGSSVVLNGSTLGNVASVEWFQLPGMTSLGVSNSVVVSSATAQNICYVFEAFGVCNGFDTVCVTYNPQPIANAGIDITIIEGHSTQLNATGGGTYIWSPSTGLNDTTISSPTATPLVTTTYYVSVTSDEGCTSTDSVTVTIIPTIHFPDGITPNGDGKNDTWVIDYIDEYPNHVVEIYNRWGELLYRSTDYKNDWNGTYNGENLPVGTYYYVIELNDDKTKPFTGPITVLR